jgi:polar amino acid transport system permease protein
VAFDPTILVQYWPLFLQGAWLTVQISAGAFVLGYALGVPIALLALIPGRLPRALVASYVTVLRGIPFIITLFLVYYGLPFAGIRMPAYLVGTVALALYASAYYAEIVRAGILALPPGQYESARAVGMSPVQAMRNVVGPQVARSVVPPSTNTTLTLIKDSSILSSITVPELTYQGLVVQGNTFAPFEVFAAVTAIYWLLTATVAQASQFIERRTGQAQAASIARNRLAAGFLLLERQKGGA